MSDLLPASMAPLPNLVEQERFYNRFRQASRELNSKLLKMLSNEALLEAGNRLGLVREGVLTFEAEHETSVLWDYALHSFRQGGRNVVQTALDAGIAQFSVSEAQVLETYSKSRYSFFLFQESDGRLSCLVRDLIRGDTLRFFDYGFAQTLRVGSYLASRLVPLPDFWITTGAAMPVGIELIRGLERSLRPILGNQPLVRPRRLNRQREADLATLIIRRALEAHAAQSVTYSDTPAGLAEHRSPELHLIEP